MNNIIKRVWNKNAMVNIEDLRGMAFQAESGGHTFQISGIDGDGNPVALSGTPAGVLLRSDNQDVTLTCSISDGKVNATLPANAYSVPGRFGITIFLTSDGQKTAIYAAVGTVGKTSSGTVAPPAGSDVVTLVNQINAAINAIPVNYNAAFAVAYENLTFPVTAGTYCIYNGALKKAIVDIATSETYTAAHWTNANFGQDLNALKSAINVIIPQPNWENITYDNTNHQWASANTRLCFRKPILMDRPYIIKSKDRSYEFVVMSFSSDSDESAIVSNNISNGWVTEFTIPVTASRYFSVQIGKASGHNTNISPLEASNVQIIDVYNILEINNLFSAETAKTDSKISVLKKPINLIIPQPNWENIAYDNTNHQWTAATTRLGIRTPILMDRPYIIESVNDSYEFVVAEFSSDSDESAIVNNNISGGWVKKFTIPVTENKYFSVFVGKGSAHTSDITPTEGSNIQIRDVYNIKEYHDITDEKIRYVNADFVNKYYQIIDPSDYSITKNYYKRVEDGSVSDRYVGAEWEIAELGAVNEGDKFRFTFESNQSAVIGSIALYDDDNKVLDYTSDYFFANYVYTVPKAGNLCVSYKYSSALTPILERKIDHIMNVSCIGDSLTYGNQDQTGNSYPKYLSELLDGFVVLNQGTGGAKSATISGMSKGFPIWVAPCTIPASGSVNVTLTIANGIDDEVFISHNMAEGNKVYIGGVFGKLEVASQSGSRYYFKFTRWKSGDAVTLTRPTQLISERWFETDNIHVIWCGTNDKPTMSTLHGVLDAIDAMIREFGDKYIIIGLTSKAYMSEIADINDKMYLTYGNRYVDARDYLLTYGLQDAGITPTAQDTTDIANGEIPTSLRADAVHLNHYGYEIIANLVYQKGKTLGYWS